MALQTNTIYCRS